MEYWKKNSEVFSLTVILFTLPQADTPVLKHSILFFEFV
jgi:hypothetical protein